MQIVPASDRSFLPSVDLSHGHRLSSYGRRMHQRSNRGGVCSGQLDDAGGDGDVHRYRANHHHHRRFNLKNSRHFVIQILSSSILRRVVPFAVGPQKLQMLLNSSSSCEISHEGMRLRLSMLNHYC